MKLVCTATIILTEDEVLALYKTKNLFDGLAANMRLENVAEINTVNPANLETAAKTIESVLNTCYSSEEF